jgi:DNA relaxase NicK
MEWLKAQLLWVVLQRRKFTLDVDDVVKILFTSVITSVQVVDSQRLNAESILGLNGTHRCKRLFLFLVH